MYEKPTFALVEFDLTTITPISLVAGGDDATRPRRHVRVTCKFFSTCHKGLFDFFIALAKTFERYKFTYFLKLNISDWSTGC
jgi:hypothetical protein